jgi:hypothetical protein
LHAALASLLREEISQQALCTAAGVSVYRQAAGRRPAALKWRSVRLNLVPRRRLPLGLLFSGALDAQENAELPRIPDVLVVWKGRDLHVETWLAPGLPKEVEQRLSSGLPTTVTWRLRLFVFHNLWLWDSLKDERRYEVTATYRPFRLTGCGAPAGRQASPPTSSPRARGRAGSTRVPKLPIFTMDGTCSTGRSSSACGAHSRSVALARRRR